jgi:hypothetical protein
MVHSSWYIARVVVTVNDQPPTTNQKQQTTNTNATLLFPNNGFFYPKPMKYACFNVILQTILEGFEALTIHLQHFLQQICLTSVKYSELIHYNEAT